MSVLPVPPLHVRPSIVAGGNQSEDDLTHQIVNVVKANIALRDNRAAGAPQIVIEQLITALQHNVSAFMDNELRGVPQITTRSGRALKTIQQRLKGKEGRITIGWLVLPVGWLAGRLFGVGWLELVGWGCLVDLLVGWFVGM